MIRFGGFDGGYGSEAGELESYSAPGEEQEVIYSVSEITAEIKASLSRSFHYICVRGEVSGVKKSSRGHIYFDLKDENAVINCVLYKWSAPSFRGDINSGMQMRVWGGITVYNSRCQIDVKNLEEEGLGQLQIAFEKLKKKLQAEGLFDVSRKRPIPPFPKQIGIVTSPSGAAIKDILSVLRRRGGNLHIILSPAAVQGKGSAEEIAEALRLLNDNFPEMDVILAGRGGGSLEDLWSFNEETVARAIAASRIPVISCVGHEIDTTIADFVADKRAETPSAAAEMVVKNREEVLQKVEGLKKRLMQGLRVYYEKLSGRFQRLASSRIMSDPMRLIERPVREIDDITERMNAAQDRLLKDRTAALALLSGKLNALSPLFPLKKGYAVVRNAAGEAVRDAAKLKKGELLSLKFYRGGAEAAVISLGEKSAGTENSAAKKILSGNVSAETSGNGAAGLKPLSHSKKTRKKVQDNPDQEMLW